MCAHKWRWKHAQNSFMFFASKYVSTSCISVPALVICSNTVFTSQPSNRKVNTFYNIWNKWEWLLLYKKALQQINTVLTPQLWTVTAPRYSAKLWMNRIRWTANVGVYSGLFQLTDRNIGNSRDTSFEQLIMSETNGRGVDLVLNSLAEEKLQASVRCLASGGRFLEIGKFDLQNNNYLGRLYFINLFHFCW